MVLSDFLECSSSIDASMFSSIKEEQRGEASQLQNQNKQVHPQPRECPQIATCFFRNHGITSMNFTTRRNNNDQTINLSIYFSKIVFSPKKAGNNKEFRTSQFRSHNKEIHPNHEISHITHTHIYILHHYTTCYTYIIIHHYASLHHYTGTSLYAHHTYNIAYYIKTNVIYTS